MNMSFRCSYFQEQLASVINSCQTGFLIYFNALQKLYLIPKSIGIKWNILQKFYCLLICSTFLKCYPTIVTSCNIGFQNMWSPSIFVIATKEVVEIKLDWSGFKRKKASHSKNINVTSKFVKNERLDDLLALGGHNSFKRQELIILICDLLFSLTVSVSHTLCLTDANGNLFVVALAKEDFKFLHSVRYEERLLIANFFKVKFFSW